MELKEYLIPIRKWWWLIVSATLLATISSFIVVGQQPDMFRARTTLMIGRAIDNPNLSGNEFWLTQQLAQTYAEIASREQVRSGTMEALGLSWLPQYAVRALPETQLIEFTVTDTNPERAQAVANMLAQQLILQSPTNTEQDELSRQAFINTQLDGLEQRIIETEADLAGKQEELASVFSARLISDLQGQIGVLQTKMTSLQSNYAGLLANTNRGAINSLTVIELAGKPLSPVGPTTSMTIVIAATIGFILATAAAYLLEYMDDSVVIPEHITRATGLPTLAGIAQISDDAEGGKLIALTHPRSPTSEAYRVLRTGIQFSSVDNPDQAKIMVTSANPSEGKSLSVANLAIVMAQAGHNVLIVDADLRRPVQHKLFRVLQESGLTSLLLELNLAAGEEDLLDALKRAIQPTSVEGLHILASGLIPPNPSELLGSSKMEVTLATLATQYDYVIVDSPPVLAVTDAVVLSQRMDGVLIVAQAGKTRTGQLEQATDQLRSGNAHLIGIVLNQISSRSDGYYSYYYYQHSDYLDDLELTDGHASPSNGRGNNRWRRRRKKTPTKNVG